METWNNELCSHNSREQEELKVTAGEFLEVMKQTHP